MLEIALMVAASLIVGVIAVAEERSLALWGGLTFLFCLLSLIIPLPYLRIIVAGILSNVVMTVANAKRESGTRRPGVRTSGVDREPPMIPTHAPTPDGMLRCPFCGTNIVATANRLCPACRKELPATTSE